MTRFLGLILAGVAASVVSAAAPVPGGTVERSTAKSADQFAACFVQTQDRATAPWWFVPKDNGGGTFSNLGAKGVTSPYFLDVRELGSRREIRLELASASGGASVARAVESCA
jgi:hypothetical protein